MPVFCVDPFSWVSHKNCESFQTGLNQILTGFGAKYRQYTNAGLAIFTCFIGGEKGQVRLGLI